MSRRMLLRIIAACLAFIPAMAFGVAAVNKYYDYYQTWGAAIADVTNQGVPAPTGPVTVSKPSTGSSWPRNRRRTTRGPAGGPGFR